MAYKIVNYEAFKADTEQFCRAVFNYYNGRINKLNCPAMLMIEWADLQSCTFAGVTSNPNIVRIYPKVIYRHANPNDPIFSLRYMIVETVIHELYHIDQLLDFARLPMDPQYSKYIEDAVEVQTAIYISNHVQEIGEQFGLWIEPAGGSFTNMIARFETGAHYNRKRYEDHVFMAIKEIISGVHDSIMDDIQLIIRSNIADKVGSIKVQIGNGDIFVIQDGGYVAPIEQINQFLWDNYYKFSHRVGNVGASYEKTTRELVINIETVNTNTMVKFAGGK